MCWDDHDLIDGVPTGSIRISFGYMNTRNDAERFVDFIEKYFVARGTAHPGATRPVAHPPLTEGLAELQPEPEPPRETAVIRQLNVFPIKGCAAMQVQSWPVGSTGMLFDREWVRVCSCATPRNSGTVCGFGNP